MPEKRAQANSANRAVRKARAVRSILDRFESNPDRDEGDPVVMLTRHGITACRAYVLQARQARAVRGTRR